MSDILFFILDIIKVALILLCFVLLNTDFPLNLSIIQYVFTIAFLCTVLISTFIQVYILRCSYLKRGITAILYINHISRLK